jgi:membrane-associated protease RseP (regulator of RpoE activity)
MRELSAPAGALSPELPPGGVDEVRRAATAVMSIDDVTAGIAPANAIRVRGHLLRPADEAWTALNAQLGPAGWTPMLRERDDAPGHELLALPVAFRGSAPRVALAATLFALTVLSCLFTGAQMIDGLGQINWNLLDGLPFAAGLLAILLAHEFGHYLVARRLGSPTSLPYFIPMPFPIGPFGTLGAVITASVPFRNKRHLLAVGAAGPLAGLVVAIPVLLAGLHLSQLQPLPSGSYMLEGNSLLYAGLKYLVFGMVLPSGGMDVFIHQLAFAGWAGLLVTGLNLIPVGQLDGGHIAYALLGRQRARILGYAMLAVMVGLVFLWNGWILWLLILFLAVRLQDMPLDDVTRLTRRQRFFAALMLVVFALTFVPVPLTFVN